MLTGNLFPLNRPTDAKRITRPHLMIPMSLHQFNEGVGACCFGGLLSQLGVEIVYLKPSIVIRETALNDLHGSILYTMLYVFVL